MQIATVAAILLIAIKAAACFRWHTPVRVNLVSPYCMRPRFYLEAHKTGTGSTKNGRDSNPKFLGIKKCHNSFAFVGNIIVRQRGAKFKCGIGTEMGRDDTIYATKSGRVQILNHRVSVLDLPAEREMIRRQQFDCSHLQPTLLTLSRLWTGRVSSVST